MATTLERPPADNTCHDADSDMSDNATTQFLSIAGTLAATMASGTSDGDLGSQLAQDRQSADAGWHFARQHIFWSVFYFSTLKLFYVFLAPFDNSTASLSGKCEHSLSTLLNFKLFAPIDSLYKDTWFAP